MSTAGDPTGHVFISYVREDRESVDRLQQVLEAAGIDVWRDTERLWPGQDWRVEIRRAITDGSFVFLACFSGNSVAREKSYQNEELILAVEQMRLRPPGAEPWLIPVRFEECQLPEFDLGAGRTLDSLQRIDLFESWERGSARLVAAILRVLGASEGAALDPAAVRGEDLGRRLRRLSRDPQKDIVTSNFHTCRDKIG